MGDLVSLSGNFLYLAFILYLLATFFFGGTIRDKRTTKSRKPIITNIAMTLTIVGFVSQLAYFILRWIASGHAPVSNMFEFVTFFGMMLVLAFIIIYFIYRLPLLGLFALPVAMIVIAYASMFPTEISPLVPSLKSHWLWIHVTTVSLSYGILAISFVAGLIYLIKEIDQTKRSKKTTWLEIIIYSLFATLGFVIISTTFNMMDYQVSFEVVEDNQATTVDFTLPAITGPKDATLLTTDRMEPWFATPTWMQGEDAPQKFNSFIWSLFTGLILYLLVRLLLRKRVAKAIQPLLQKVNRELVDEINYRAVAIGFPVFSLGGLVFAMIWAQEAWNRYWGWDPKEVWALITFFFYAAYLHLRLSRGWHGEKSAWLAVIGFAIIMFNLVAVNLILAGLHSYA